MALKKLKVPAMSADKILALLAARHSEDVFVPECKDGPSQASCYVRMDAWAMKRSWANPLVCGYEIKVSRSDFVQDNKWPAYLPLCNAFYFVCPAGLIQESEVPDTAGLLCCSSNGTMLYQKKKAPYRQVEIPEALFRYILMARARIGDEIQWRITEGRGNRLNLGADFWRNWLAEKEEKRTLGYNVSRAIREHVESVERENKRLKDKHDQYDEVRRALEALGIKEPDKHHVGEWTVKSRIAELKRLVPPHFRSSLQKLEDSAKAIREELTRIEMEGEKA